jgi:hypothetical protein
MYEFNHRVYLCNLIKEPVQFAASLTSSNREQNVLLLSNGTLQIAEMTDLRKMNYVTSFLDVKAKQVIVIGDCMVSLSSELVSGEGIAQAVQKSIVLLHDAATFANLDRLEYSNKVRRIFTSGGGFLFVGGQVMTNKTGFLDMYKVTED